MMRSAKRLQRELERLREDASQDLQVSVISPEEWQVSFTEYPIESPSVVFLLPSPVHPHIYSNGHICLNILGDDWSPALTVKSVYLSILSMLSSCTLKVLPPDNAQYVRRKDNNADPKQTRFAYHDDTV